ncbi:MAG: hypothetical protein JWM57_3905 [Phycisphaerales bacterium]|nr:hypothetical protein [Phycisphaerales bacterium]
MKTTIFAIVALLLGADSPSFAHRLDEYLQATKVTIDRDRIGLDICLTPGVAVLPTVLAKIDIDHDGVMTAAEQQAYAQRVKDDLFVTVDAAPVPLHVASSSFPDVEEMKQGLGEIVLRLSAAVPPGGHARTLTVRNEHLRPLSVYLANCLVPTDTAIHITTQSRSYDQAVYSVGYTQDATGIKSATASTPRDVAEQQATSFSLFQGYVLHGIGHILTGYDHLLFVSALVLATATLWDLIKVVSAFTLAHTLTLTLAAIGVVHVSPRIVEPFIAASIFFVAVQNVFWPSQAKGRSRLAVAFFFGLFHGLGFAGGLLEVIRELPSGTMLLSILAFSVGVEIGHQMVVLPLFALLKAARISQRDIVLRNRLSMVFQRFGSAGISLAGFYYFCIALSPVS